MLYVLINGGLVPADEAPEVSTLVPEIPQDVVDSITEFKPTAPVFEVPMALDVPVLPEIK